MTTTVACCSSTSMHDVDPDDGGEHWVKPPPAYKHPAKFTPSIIDAMRKVLAPELTERGALKVLDPFAGPGGIHQLADVGGVETFGVELQPEWARMHPSTICGSVLELPAYFPRGTFNVLATSYCYGNRMADSHVATDPCKACEGRGWPDVDSPDGSCRACWGSGLSKRNTYTHYLRMQGVEPVESDDNAAQMQWGAKYRAFHQAAWKACRAVLAPGSLIILNGKNHYVGDTMQRVVEFHLNDWLVHGAVVEQVRKVPVTGNGQGANGSKRVPYETVAALRWLG